MLTPDYIAKIEGHGKLDISFSQNKARLVVEEGERLFEGLVIGRPYYDIPFIVSRICGICPTAHYLASIKALESALEVKVDSTAIQLRKILLLAQITQSHILHAFYLSLPDYIEVDDINGIAKYAPAEFALGIRIKKVSDKIVEIIGGRAVHPVTPVVGGFTKFPNKKELTQLRDDLENSLEDLGHMVRFFSRLQYPELKRETEYLALNHDAEYAFYDGLVLSSHGQAFKPEQYKQQIKEIIKNYSTAKFAKRQGKGFMVGALARISIHPETLNHNAKSALDEYFPGEHFPSYNSFHNNFAQVIEILHCYEEMIKLLNQLIEEGIGQTMVKFAIKAGQGVGAVEAPRGTLYHYYKLDKNGLVTDCDIVTPTVQNLTNIEEDANQLLRTTKSLINKKRADLLERLVRAYDPCITCSVH